MPLIELHFPVLGAEIPADHGYALYGALAALVPKLHTDEDAATDQPDSRHSMSATASWPWERVFPTPPVAADDLPVVLPLQARARTSMAMSCALACRK